MQCEIKERHVTVLFLVLAASGCFLMACSCDALGRLLTVSVCLQGVNSVIT